VKEVDNLIVFTVRVCVVVLQANCVFHWADWYVLIVVLPCTPIFTVKFESLDDYVYGLIF